MLSHRFMASCINLFLIIFISICFAKTCVAVTGNSSSIRASYIYYLDSGLPSTWYNNNSVMMDGWQMRVFLVYPKDPQFYCGFYCNGTCESYYFSIVQVVGGIASLIWSPHRDRPVRKNAMVQLTNGGLSLRDSNGSRLWSINTTGASIAGMNLTEAGKLVLFNNEGTSLWQSTIQSEINTTSTNTTTQNDYCRSGDGLCSEGLCSCPVDVDGVEYFKQNQSQFAEVGCSRITPLSCNSPSDQQKLVEVRNFTYLNINDTKGAHPVIKNMEGCKQSCSQNCSCGGAFFRYDSDASDGYCFMPSRILVIRGGQTANYTFRSASFIKVQIPSHRTEKPKPPKGNNLAAIAAGSGAGAFLLLCFLIFMLMKLRKTGEEEEEEDVYTNKLVQVPGMPVRFSYEDLKRATDEFKERLGRGGFGSVFKGMLPDGTKIAVKRLDKKGPGMREFFAEVETIGSIHHFNLVRLIGFCAEKSYRLLVYEYMTNGSLDNWIFSGSQGGHCLNWQSRKKIILDIAKGLAYLHEDCRRTIVHLDIKPQNILLDENFNAKVSDFGLSELIDKDENQALITMRGTPGYLAPEWRENRITVKADIYSFGIVLLEIVTGRRHFDQTRAESSSHMLGLLQKKGEEDRLIDIVEIWDEDINNREELERMIKIGAWCLQDDPTRRPPMSVVVKVLEGVMEVDSNNIVYKFVHAMAPPLSVLNGRVSTVEPSVLSHPR